jgi:hypothetical protein
MANDNEGMSWLKREVNNELPARLDAVVQSGGCLGLSTEGDKHAEMDAYGKANRLTVVFAPWHLNPQYQIFKTGSLLSRNEEYPSGLVIVNERGAPQSWQAPELDCRARAALHNAEVSAAALTATTTNKYERRKRHNHSTQTVLQSNRVRSGK